jgi:long-chain acyl-CoA synthetase
MAAAGRGVTISVMSTLSSSPAPTPIDAGSPSVARVILDAAERHRGVALRVRDGDGWSDTTFAELRAAAVEVAAGLIELGIRSGDAVGILGETRPEWTLADCGTLLAGATVVPVYQTCSPEECRYVLEHAGVRLVICEDAAQLSKLEQIRAGLPELEHVFTMTPIEGVPSLQDLRGLAGGSPAESVERAVASVAPDDVATIVYTSGTTGPPKGCALTHANCIATMSMYEGRLELHEGIVLFMFLPLAHVLARMVQFVALDLGATLAYWSRDPRLLLDDLAAARPTHFPAVPRVYEKVHSRALAAAEEASPLRRRLFEWGIATGAAARALEREGRRPNPLMRAKHLLADRLVLTRVRDLFGGAIELGLTGAAPIGRDVLEFFDACGVLVLEGYGMTETCAAATLNTPDGFQLGTVGRPLPGVGVMLAEDGEILLRGPNVFRGYHRDPAATAEVLADDWLRTGDLGSIDADGFLAITGRKKDLIITSSGKNVAPSNLETALRESRWISEAVVFGDNRPYLVALVTLDRDELPELAHRAGVAPDPALMATDPRVLEAVQADVDEINLRFARIEQIKRFAILEGELSQAEGELTPTLKVKRAAVAAHYLDRVNALYA